MALEVYGEWIALSASVNYLGTLNYGIQTYANNEMTIRYNRGDESAARTIQASAFRLLIVLFVSFAALGLVVFLLPIQPLLKLRHETTHVAALTLYLLILQIAFAMMFNLLANSYMVVGKLHRGQYMQSAQRLFMALAMAFALAQRASLPVACGNSAGLAAAVFLHCARRPAACGTRAHPFARIRKLEGSQGNPEAERTLRPHRHGGIPDVASPRTFDSTCPWAGYRRHLFNWCEPSSRCHARCFP